MKTNPWGCLCAGWLLALSALTAAQAQPVVGDAYIEGYAAAVLAEKFGLTAPSLAVRQGVVSIAESDLAGADRARVVGALARVRGVVRVEVQKPVAPAGPAVGAPPGRAPATAPAPSAADSEVDLVWKTGFLPGGTLFRPVLADPRWPHFYAVVQRYLDHDELGAVTSVGIGETFTAYRGRIGRHLWEFGLQAGVFSIFDLDSESLDLINTDYIVGAFLGYRRDTISAIARLYHQSSHLGDEFVLRRPIERVNLSFENVDAKVSWEPGSGALRVYGGGGYMIRRNPRDLDPWSLQYGVEARSPWRGAVLPDLGVRPVAALDLQHREEHDWEGALSLRAGLQFEGVLLPMRDVQLLVEYFDGHSPNGQFFRSRVEYLGVGLHLHF